MTIIAHISDLHVSESDFNEELFINAPDVKVKMVEKDGVAPKDYHSTSMYPEYFKIKGQWANGFWAHPSVPR